MFFILAFKESIALLVALFAGLLVFKHLNFLWRLLWLQAFLYFIVIITSYAVTLYQRDHHIPYNNQWVYNISMLIENTLLFFVASKYLEKRIHKMALLLMILPFYLVFCCQFYMNSFLTFANYAYAVSGISVSMLYSIVLYFYFTNKNVRVFRSPEIYMSIGLVLYFACSVPYISLFAYLQKYFPHLTIFLFDYIIDFLSNLRYVLLALAFLLFRFNYNPIQPKLNVQR